MKTTKIAIKREQRQAVLGYAERAQFGAKLKLFFMAALALMTAACSNDDNDLTTPQPQKAEGITITAQLAPKTDGATTRAVSDGGNKIISEWAENEHIAILYTVGSTKKVADAEITAVDGGGTATITFTVDGGTTNDTPCTLVYPLSAAKDDHTGVKDAATLLAAQDGTLNANLDVRVGAGTIRTTTPGLDVTTQPAAQYSIFKFTLGSAIDGTHPLYVKDDADNVITTVTPTSSTTTAYVALEPATSKYYKFSATTAENKIISKSSTATIVAGQFYQTTLACPVLGDLYYSDGTYSSTLVAGKTPIGVIAYLGTDNFTENGTTVGGNTFAGHGLVLCLKNAASGADAQWSTETSTYEFGGDAKVTNADGLKRTTNVSGYTNTKTLAEKTDAATKYKAAYAAKNYTGLMAPAGTTGWFLPSAQQWVKMQTGLGGLAVSAIVWGSWFNNDHSAATAWETAMAKAGTKDTVYDSMTDAYLFYWSSSEYSAYNAVKVSVDARGTGGEYGFYWYDRNKDDTSDRHRVRPVLAF
ncbi:MAG: hypothetical protein IJ551_03620 [Prevotella sp.]|nr:hypothetical protein [Prevotella sp.]